MGRWSGALVLLLAAPSALRAQDRSPRLGLSVPPSIAARTDAPTVSLANILAEGHRRELLNAGWPAVLHCRVELWKKSRIIVFNRHSFAEWDIIVEYIPATGRFQIRRQEDGKFTELGEFATIEEAEQVIDRPYRVPLSPDGSGGRYYYVFSLDLSTLSMTDLDAWQRWVRGDAAPAARGKGNILTTLQRGFGSLLSRVLGGETQHYESRSRIFAAG